MRRSSEDAHLWASDTRLFATTLDHGPDLYASDVTLFAADDAVRSFGADLWASDAALFATSEDRARLDKYRVKRWLEMRATTGVEYGTRGAYDDDTPTCAVCLGEMAVTREASELSGVECASAADSRHSSHESEPTNKIVVLPCSHAYHLNCASAALCVTSPAERKPTCPTCRADVLTMIDSAAETR
jgi:hypothetical protein